MRALKAFIISLLILSNLGCALTVPLIFLNFEMRRDYIYKVLCINRDKPITVCGGSCFLAEQLNTAQENQEDQEASTPKPFTFFVSKPAHLSTVNRSSMQFVQDDFNVYDEAIYSSLVVFDIFHPPRTA